MEFRAMDAGSPPASDLIEAMVEELIPLYGRIDVPHAPSASAADFSPPGGTFLVGFDESGEAVCGGGVKRLGDGVCEIKRMFVVPEARGRGHGRRVLEALERVAADLGYRRVRLDTARSMTTAMALYESAGYRPIPDYNGNRYASFWGEKEL